jgi:chromosome segregation protein
MKRLESIGLVQFFLYEREDLQVGTNTAFLGPNGTGKTAFLDALQTVFLAADGNRMHFNASGEGKKRARSLRDYCLGIYGQTAAERCRDSANTYIDLVFRDPRTNTPVTAGISLSVAADQPETHLNSLYILPGVAMNTRMHVEREAGRDVVQPWRAFQHVAADACRMHGTTPFFTTNREEFTRRLLLEHLALPGDRPNVHALRLAFARSLKLNQDVSDLNETLRHHLIEARPTNIREFRARLDQFRDVRDLIRRLKERVGRAGEVIDRYAIVQRERTSEANLAALKATYTTDRLGCV